MTCRFAICLPWESLQKALLLGSYNKLIPVLSYAVSSSEEIEHRQFPILKIRQQMHSSVCKMQGRRIYFSSFLCGSICSKQLLPVCLTDEASFPACYFKCLIFRSSICRAFTADEVYAQCYCFYYWLFTLENCFILFFRLSVDCPFKGDLLCFFSLPLPSLFYEFLCMQKVKDCSNRGSSLAQKTLLLEQLVSGPAFNSVTLWHHTT